MRSLPGNVTFDALDVRVADGKRSVSRLPAEGPAIGERIVDPLRGIGLDEPEGLGDRHLFIDPAEEVNVVGHSAGVQQAAGPGPDDPARMSLIGALLHGPVFLPRLWLWAWRRSQRDLPRRRWLLAEALWAVGVVAAGGALLSVAPAVLIYAALALLGSWVYPLLTVHLPHRNYGETPLDQTHTLRGVLVPAVFLELTYHLEHHLYPSVPSHHLAELSRRLDPYLDRARVQPRRVL